MLPREFRLPLKSGVHFKGQSQRFPWFTLIFQPNSLTLPRFAVVVPKKIIPLATARHRLARRLHSYFLGEVSHLPAQDLLLIINKNEPENIFKKFSEYLIQQSPKS